MRFKTILLITSLLILATCVSAQDFQSIDKKINVPSGKTLKMVIQIDAGEVFAKKHAHSAQVAVSGKINKKFDNLEINYNKKSNEISVFLDHDKWLKSTRQNQSSKIQIFLPDDIIIEFSSEIKAGKINFDIGGLSLKNFELRTTAGEVAITFDEANQIPMEFLDIDIKIGSAKLSHLGNARFEDGRINGGIGELEIDFRGKGSNSAHADIDLDMGSTKVILPRDLGIKLRSTTFGFLTDSNVSREFERRGRYYFSQNYDKQSRTLSLAIHSGIGELDVYFR
ncbi:hypothetical protein B6D60_01060 [candidate division KSB1 bacterium 4484_87]|nr:MAG: hypothetical protein B6D60_01060 [candidate division KSB1 bacterium 4484_87]